MIGSFSISCCKFLTSLILSHQEVLVEYRLMTCLPKAFPVFSPFSFSSRCLYSAYVLLIILSRALSTLPCVHLCPNKWALPLSMTLFNSSLFLCCTMPSFGVSTTSLKNSFNMAPTPAIIFIKCQSPHHMKNNIRYKGNANNTSVIIFLIGGQISQWYYFAWENLQGAFCDVGCNCSFVFGLHFVAVFHFVVVVFRFIAFYAMLFFIHCFSTSFLTLLWTIARFYTHFILSAQPNAEWFMILSFSTFLRSSFHSVTSSTTVLSGHFLPTGFFFYLPLLHWYFTCVYQGLPGSQQFFFKFGGLHTDPRNRTSPSVCLIHSNTRSSYSEPFIFKFYQTLSWITCGKKFSLYAPYLFWTLFACSKSYVKTIKKHLWTRVVTAYNYFDECYFKKAVRRYIKDSMSNGYKMFLKLKYLFNSK